MSDAPTPDPLDGEVLSAYLTGELDEDATAALETRLAHDHALGRRLDATARMLGALRGVDEVEPPPGAAERLRQRLAEAGMASQAGPHGAQSDAAGADAAGADAAGADAAGGGGGEPAAVTTLASRRRVPWSAVAGVAAGLAAVALVGGGLVQGFGNGLDTDDAEDLAEADGEGMRPFAQTEQADPREDRAADQDVAAPDESAPLPAAVELPFLRDEAVALAGEAAVRARYAGLPEAQALLGEPLPAAEERAVAARAVLDAAPAFRDGTRPGACLDQAGALPPAVPVLVESAVLDGRAVLVHVLVGSSPGATALDRVSVQVRAVPDCAEVLDVDLD